MRVASSRHSADDTAAERLRESLDLQPRRVALSTPAEGALLAAVAEACGESAENDDGNAASLSPAVPEPPVAMPDAAPAPASLMLALLSEAAVAAAPPDSPERAAREAAAADDHERSCALLRAMSSGDAMDVDDVPMAPAMPALQTAGEAQTPPDEEDAALPAMMEPPATRPDEAVASDATLRAFAAELRGTRTDAAQPACADGGSPEQPLPAPPALGACCASAEPRLLHAALLHALVLAPALAPPAAHVRTLPPPFVLPEAAAPTPAALIMAAARAGGAVAAPGIAARAELELPWGADAEALASDARGARVAAARLPQRVATADETPAPPRSIMQLLDAEPDAQPQHDEEPEAPVAPPAAIAPPPPMRAPPARTAGALAAIHGRDVDDVARFARQLQPGSVVTITAEPRLHCHQLPHGAAWRALRSAAAGVAARDVARYDARDAAALTDDQNAPDAQADPFWAGGPDLDALRQRIRAVAASAPGHAASLAACYALHAAAQTLALCGARAAAAYLDGAMRAAPAIAEQPTAMAAARSALAGAVHGVASPQEDHPAAAATLRAAMLAAAGGKLAVIADARSAPMAAAAMAAAGVRLSVLEHGGAFEIAACGGDVAGVAAALRDAAAGCDALLMTHAQAGHAGSALSQLFAAAALLSPPPPGPAAAIAALLTAPRRSFGGAVHVCVVHTPCHVTPRPPPPPAVPHHRYQPPAPMPQPPATAPPAPEAAPVHASRPYGDDGDDDGGFATGLVALGARSAVLRSWPALRDAILRLEGRRGASVATRELGAPCESDSTNDAAAALLRTPDALALGPAGAVVALRVLRGGAEAALLAAAAAIEPHCLAAECAALAARTDALALVIIAASPAAARAIAPHAAIVAAAAASAALPLRLVVAADDSTGRDAVLAALDWALDAPPDRAPSALRALPDATPPGEALLRCCGGLNALAAHALLCSGVPLAALLRPDLTDAGAVAAAAAAGGVALSEASLHAFDAFRGAQLGAPPVQEAPPEPEPAWHRAPQPQPWEAAQAAAAREAWRAAPSPQGGWREARAAAAATQQHHYARPPAPQPMALSPSPSLNDDDVAALFDDPPPSAAWALPAIAPPQPRAHAQPASSATMGPPAGCRPVVSAGYGGNGDGSVRGLLDDWLKKVRVIAFALHQSCASDSCISQRRVGDAAPQQPRVPAAVPQQQPRVPRPTASSSSSDGSDDMRGFLRGLDAAPRAPPQQQQQVPRPHWFIQPAMAAPAASASAAPPPPAVLDAFRCAPPRGPAPMAPMMAGDHGGGGGFVFEPRSGAAKRLRFTDAAPSPAASAAAGGGSMMSLGGVRFAPGVLPRGPPGAGGGRALAAPSAPLPPPPGVATLRATPEAKQKLQELLQKMGRGGGGKNKPKAARTLL